MVSRMFASLKNKIKEETGSEVPRLFTVRPRSPRQGSISSMSSVLSGDVDTNHSSLSDTNMNQSRSTEKSKDANLLQEIHAKERELMTRLDRMEREHTQMLEKRERHHAMQLEEKDREWEDKMTSLQNNMHSAEAVWSGEAAAARREAREEARKSAARAEQLANASAAAARAQDRLDALTEEIEAERRGWALERVRLAAAAEDALHRLSLVETPLHDENGTGGGNSNEIALKRKLEEAQLHLHDIKTSWSGQIAALETQVGRLSRQAGEEGSERRRVEKEKEALMERLREKEIQLEQAQATLEDKDAKDSLSNKLSETEHKLAECQEQCDTLQNHNINLKEAIVSEEKKLSTLRKDFEALNIDKNEWSAREKRLKDEIMKLESKVKASVSARELENQNTLSLVKEMEGMKEQMDNLKHELNEIHNRYDKERRDKDESLLRNAHMSQTLEIYRQEMRQQEIEVVDLKTKVSSLEKTLAQNIEEQAALRGLRDQMQQCQAEIETLKSERDTTLVSEKQLQESVKDLNAQISEKTKNIRVLQNRLADMKKTLQRELRGGQVDPLGSSVVEGSTEDPDVSKKYLKHVLIKFLTSREIEARQLTRAVGALLGLSEQEESLLRDTLGWRSGLAAWLAPSPPRFPHS